MSRYGAQSYFADRGKLDQMLGRLAADENGQNESGKMKSG
jgi:hypothetical protein